MLHVQHAFAGTFLLHAIEILHCDSASTFHLCNDFRSCSNNNNETRNFDYDTSVNCFGASTCRSSKIQCDALVCYGDSSCQKLELQARNQTFCDGYGSCMNGSLSTNSGIQCSTDSSCSNSNISFDINTNNNNDYNMNPIPSFGCSAFKSCNNITIWSESTYSSFYYSNIRRITGSNYGVFSGFNSSIYSNGNDVVLTLNGYYSGYGLTIHCTNKYDTCSIYCYGNACVGLTLDCGSDTQCTQSCKDSSCIEYDSFDNNDLQSDSMVYQINSEIGVFDTQYNILPTAAQSSYINIVESDSICTDEKYTFADAFAVTPTNIILDSNASKTTDICCLAGFSCFGKNIQNTNSYNYITLNVYCTGLASCNQLQLTNASNIYALGIYALWSGTVSNFNGIIMCNSVQACNHTTLTDGKLLACMAYQACANSTIKNVDIIIGIGYQALFNATIINATKVYLLSYQSGDQATITNSTTNTIIYCQNNACNDTSFGDSIFYCNSNSNSNSDIDLKICTMTSQSPTLSPTMIPTESEMKKEFDQLTSLLNNTTLIIGTVLMVIGSILSLLSKICRGKKHHASMESFELLGTMDNNDNDNNGSYHYKARTRSRVATLVNYVSGFGQNASHLVLLKTTLEMYDVFTDLSYLIFLISNGYWVSFEIFVTSMILTIFMNACFVIHFIKHEFSHNIKFRQWFWQNSSGVIICILFFSILTDGSMTISSLTSQIFGHLVFYSPISMKSITTMNIASILSIFVEHIPQLFVQFYVIFVESADTFTQVVFASLLVSCVDICFIIVNIAIWFFVLRSRS